MKYFIDCEFIEGFHKPLFGKRRHFIDLISIGIVAEDGREYYAISNEFNENKASQWVKDNVINSIIKSFHGDQRNHLLDISIKGVKHLFGKPVKQIANEIVSFVYDTSQIYNPHSIGNWDEVKHLFPIEFYGYYCGFDMVLLASMFGNMDQLPKGFPMYWNDLKQTLDEKAKEIIKQREAKNLVVMSVDKEADAILRSVPPFPVSVRNEHNALADARWNFELYKFIQTI